MNRAANARRRPAAAYAGAIAALAAVSMCLPLAVCAITPGESRLAWAFLVPAALLASVGGALWGAFAPRGGRAALSTGEITMVVVAGWGLVLLASAGPFLLGLGLTPLQALFESVSGWTTTGLSVVDVEACPRALLFWRSEMQLLGGAGLAVVMLAAIAGPPGTGLSRAEGRADQLGATVRDSARIVCSLLGAYALAGTLAYRLAGMGWFDALNHAFAAVSTGGFSTRAGNIGAFDSWAVEAVSFPLMLLGALNFVTARLFFTGRLRPVWKNAELRAAVLLGLAGALCLYALVCRELYAGLGKQVRVAIFETVSALTTTGFSSEGYSLWSGAGLLVLICLMLAGGGTGSTAGGLKLYRVQLLARAVAWDVRRALLPSAAVVEHAVWSGRKLEFVDDARVRSAALYAVLFLASWLAGALVLAACGNSLADALFEFASAIGTVGLSVGVTRPDAPAAVLLAEMAGMVLGRLEFFVVFMGLQAIWNSFRSSPRAPRESLDDSA